MSFFKDLKDFLFFLIVESFLFVNRAYVLFQIFDLSYSLQQLEKNLLSLIILLLILLLLFIQNLVHFLMVALNKPLILILENFKVIFPLVFNLINLSNCVYDLADVFFLLCDLCGRLVIIDSSLL